MQSVAIWQMVQETHTLAGDEGDELAHALLHALLGFFCDFGIFGKGKLHDSRDWSKVTYVSIGRGIAVRVCARWRRAWRGSGGLWRRGRHFAGCTSDGSQAHKEADWLADATVFRDSTQRRASGESVGIQRRPLEQSVDVQMGA